ncbi:MAG: S-methyl-5-thioribose-1-phosphate isomerase [Candidatus Micrarchaeia archaeon]
MKWGGRKYRSVWFEKNNLYIIDQRLLPHRFRVLKIGRCEEVVDAIRSMGVRGAPAIGVCAAYALNLACVTFKGRDPEALRGRLRKCALLLKKTRPTAFDLFRAIDRVVSAADRSSDVEGIKKEVYAEARAIDVETRNACRLIGLHGQELIKKGYRIMTHCNAGALASVDYGTALSPLRFAHRSRKNIFVYVSETRPRLQGALTALELKNEGIPHRVIVDGAQGYFISQGLVDAVFVGADRIARDGFANKIGTYPLAVLAHEKGIPFYVAAPLSTFDLGIKMGEIEIEERDEGEVLEIGGRRIFPKGTRAFNPAFDITPFKYVTAIVCERGIFKPTEVGMMKWRNTLV